MRYETSISSSGTWTSDIGIYECHIDGNETDIRMCLEESAIRVNIVGRRMPLTNFERGSNGCGPTSMTNWLISSRLQLQLRAGSTSFLQFIKLRYRPAQISGARSPWRTLTQTHILAPSFWRKLQIFGALNRHIIHTKSNDRMITGAEKANGSGISTVPWYYNLYTGSDGSLHVLSHDNRFSS
jgi:hypothetical protein